MLGAHLAEGAPSHAHVSRLPSLSDNCKKFNLVFDDVVGIVDVINSKGVAIQVRPWVGPPRRGPVA